MLDTTTDGHATTVDEDHAAVIAPAPPRTVNFQLPYAEWKRLEEAAALEGRDPHAQAKAWVQQKMGVFKTWQRPVAPATDKPKRKR